MNEWLVGLLFAYPKAFIFCGRVLFSLGAAMAVLGLRFGKLGDMRE